MGSLGPCRHGAVRSDSGQEQVERGADGGTTRSHRRLTSMAPRAPGLFDGAQMADPRAMGDARFGAPADVDIAEATPGQTTTSTQAPVAEDPLIRDSEMEQDAEDFAQVLEDLAAHQPV